MKARADFSLTALYDALDERRASRNMSWAAVMHEINALFCDVPGHKTIASSTVTGLSRKSAVEGDGVLQMLLWLRRSPESFVPGFEGADAARYRLRELAPNRILRWDSHALHHAMNAQRRSRGMSWKEVASEVGGCRHQVLTRLEKGGRTTLPAVMRYAAWLERPAADFTRASEW